MNLDPNIGLALGFNLLVGGIAWGALRQRVKGVEDSQADLKRSVDDMRDLDTRMAVIESRIDGIYEQFKDLNASIRWMRDPAGYAPRLRSSMPTDGGA